MKDQRCLRLTPNKKLLSDEKLLEKVRSVIQSVAIEMFPIKHGQFREIVTDIFTEVT